jgi:hypothetical protein
MRKIWILLDVVLALTFLIQGCVPSTQNKSPLINPTSNPTTSPSVSSPDGLISSSNLSPSITLPSGTELTFENIIKSGNLGGSYQGETAQIRVVSSLQTPLPEEFNWIYPDSKNMILAVDFTKYFVVMVFNGSRGGIYSNLKILQIWQTVDMILVLTHFNDFIPQATSLPASNSQYQVVKIARTQITQPGVNMFKLLDGSGQERAITIQNISK